MKRIDNFEDFKTNEGLGKKISTVALLAALGILSPEAAMANRDTTVANAKAGEEGNDVLRLVAGSDELSDSLENGTEKKIDLLMREVGEFRRREMADLDFYQAVGKMQDPEFPLRINIMGYRMGDDDGSIATFSYDLTPNATFTITKNPLWNTSLYGIKIKF